MTETFDVVFVLFLILGIVVTVYCGAMWIILYRREAKSRDEFFLWLRDGEDK